MFIGPHGPHEPQSHINKGFDRSDLKKRSPHEPHSHINKGFCEFCADQIQANSAPFQAKSQSLCADVYTTDLYTSA
jgi:hypothetical protein